MVVNAPVLAFIANTPVVPLVYVTAPFVPPATVAVTVAVLPVVPYIMLLGVDDVHDNDTEYFCTVIVMFLLPAL